MEQRIDIKDGVASKIPKRVFRISDLHQCVYHNAECLSEEARPRTDPAAKYIFLFVFKVSD